MSKGPRKPDREDFNEAAFRVVREATEGHEPEPQADGDSGPEPQQAKAADTSARWAAPTDEETPPPKIL
jgi:hypothetical protein